MAKLQEENDELRKKLVACRNLYKNGMNFQPWRITYSITYLFQGLPAYFFK